MGGAEHLLNGIFCTFSWIVLSFGYEEVVDGEGSKPRTSLRRSVTREDLKRRKLRLLQKISEDRETMQKTLWSLIVFHNFLSDQSIHLKKDFFYQIYWLPTRPLLSTAVDHILFNSAQQFLLSHCALPQQSAHTGGATNECSRGV